MTSRRHRSVFRTIYLRLLMYFRLHREREEHEAIIQAIHSGITFRGTNLWVLIFAILIASLGLNLNAPAVIIGAMLISPLMGPIMGLGLGLAMNDLRTVRKALNNYIVAFVVSITTSTLFFLISPIDDAQSEILARTSPTVYDVLIATFGGFAGIVAVSSRLKGNVIPGVAIATALMPPLCTAGFGLANLNVYYLFGALYLFIINSVFIAWATFITCRLLKMPVLHLADPRAERVAHRWIWVATMLTLLPSIYFGYDMVQRARYVENANRFVDEVAVFPNDYLLKKTIDPQRRTIDLVFGGAEIPLEEIERVENRLPEYRLEGTILSIKQGFAYLTETQPAESAVADLTSGLVAKDAELQRARFVVDSIELERSRAQQLFAELRVQYPQLVSLVVEPSTWRADTSGTMRRITLVLAQTQYRLPRRDVTRIEEWLKTRMRRENVVLVMTP